MKNIEECLAGVSSMGIAGHIRPDGDAVGTTMALYLYVRKYHPQIHADIFLDDFRPVFGHIARIEEVKSPEEAEDFQYDLFAACDVSAMDRLGIRASLFEQAKKTVCIDHHISNTGFADENHIRGDISSCSEVLYSLMDPEKVDLEIATALYTGIIHDTGVLQYAATTADTLRITASFLELGVDFSSIIKNSFYLKTYIQNQVMGRVLAESIMLIDGKCIVGYLRRRDMAFYGIGGPELDGIVNQLLLTEGVEAAVFLYEAQTQEFKVSLRSAGRVDVSEAALYFAGGGHHAAAGCTVAGTFYDVINAVVGRITVQLEEMGIYPLQEENG